MNLNGWLKTLTGCVAVVVWGTAYGNSMFGGSVMKSTPLYDGSDTEFTGRLEDRVNLWPLGYYREPAFSLLWPVFSVTDDHLAIRPIYTQYRQRGPGSPYDEFNFLWPLCQFDTRHDDYRVFPFFWGDDYFVAFPAFFHVADTWVVPPVIVPGDGSGFGIFPLAVFDWSGSDRLGCVFPAFYSHSWNDGKSRTAWFAAGLAGWKTRQEALESSWLAPLYWARPQERMFASPFWASQGEMGDRVRYGGVPALLTFAGYDPRNENRFGRLAGGLVGWNKAKGGVFSNWAFPLYYRDNAKFLSLPWSGTFADGKLSGWCLPPALSWRADDGRGDARTRVLLGLAGSNRTAGGFTSSWLFPFWYHNSDGLTVTPLAGWRQDAHWIFPLWYSDDRTFVSALWAHGRDADGGLSWAVCPLGLTEYYYDAKSDEDRLLVLAGLAGKTRDRRTGKGSEWVAPLYYRDSEGVFATLLGGRAKDASWLFPLYYKDDHDFFTLLYGCTRYGETRRHVFPLLLSEVHRDSDRYGEPAGGESYLLGLAGREQDKYTDKSWCLPLWYRNKGEFTSLVYGNWAFGSQTNNWWGLPILGTRRGSASGAWLFPIVSWTRDADYGELKRAMDSETLDPSSVPNQRDWWGASDDVSVLLGLGGSEKSVCCHTRGGETNEEYKVEFDESREMGNVLLAKRTVDRSVTFDLRRKTRTESYEKDSSVLCHLLWSAHEERRADGTCNGEESVLWRVWHRVREDGNVAVDMFPFVTYDSKTNGFTKTSFFWRLFRYEKDPASGTKVDLLFLPVWR